MAKNILVIRLVILVHLHLRGMGEILVFAIERGSENETNCELESRKIVKQNRLPLTNVRGLLVHQLLIKL